MNYYIIVEGVGEKSVYINWIPIINRQLSFVDDLSNVVDNNFYIVSGYGYPNYFKVIEDGIKDINNLGIFQKFVISVDAEDMSYADKYNEINNFVDRFHCNAEIHIIIQYYCLETWALGNQAFPRRNTSDKILRSYFSFYDVVKQDPELLPSFDITKYNRAQFSSVYLHKIINDRNNRLTYTKTNPSVLISNGYFTQIQNRLRDTNHIISFQHFIDTFR